MLKGAVSSPTHVNYFIELWNFHPIKESFSRLLQNAVCQLTTYKRHKRIMQKASLTLVLKRTSPEHWGVSDGAFYTAVFTVPQFHSCVMDVLSEILNQNRIFTNNETEYFKYFSRIHSVDKQHICANQDYNIVVFCANRTIQFLCALAGREEDKCLYFKC